MTDYAFRIFNTGAKDLVTCHSFSYEKTQLCTYVTFHFFFQIHNLPQQFIVHPTSVCYNVLSLDN